MNAGGFAVKSSARTILAARRGYRRDVHRRRQKPSRNRLPRKTSRLGSIYPPLSRILDASLHVAKQVDAYIFDKDLARVRPPKDIEAFIRARAYRPVYPE